MSLQGCWNCKYRSFDVNQGPCASCFGNSNYPNWTSEESVEEETPVTDDKNISMIKSIIDEAMEKKDRSVTVYISGDSMHVSVYPLDEDRPRWIDPMKNKRADVKDRLYISHWLCSCCGASSTYRSRYCPTCGEALKSVDEEVLGNDH